ncbi:uncharacterized protein FPRO_14771 [Fusarium proliferatum ET1]|uniref:Uncharacterized protein n=1 Tax=Fusarium proliferatum (strain ET1) TaxID=1227346 RepID=A0A1L7WAY2_FUSPR|nr:uncharacterized protein FPRO_14771 [Fusarium proliferatum ET1]CZR49752.1 uncharacterized protein FPRO_14771 [Fusarium proliferatum ET1]
MKTGRSGGTCDLGWPSNVVQEHLPLCRTSLPSRCAPSATAFPPYRSRSHATDSFFKRTSTISPYLSDLPRTAYSATPSSTTTLLPPHSLSILRWVSRLPTSTPNTGVMGDASRCAFPTGSSRDQSPTYSKPRTANEPSYSEIDAKQGLEATDKTW